MIPSIARTAIQALGLIHTTVQDGQVRLAITGVHPIIMGGAPMLDIRMATLTITIAGVPLTDIPIMDTHPLLLLL